MSKQPQKYGDNMQKMKDEYLDVVDGNDRVIGKKLRSELIKSGQKNYRVVNIFLFNPKGEVWLPRRTKDKRYFPNCYDFSCGEHLMPGEDYEEAALRGLKEELNIELPKEELLFLGKLTPKDGVSSFMKVYKVLVDKEPQYNKGDFSSASFVSLNRLEEMISASLSKFKDDFSKVYKLLVKKPS